ncbi:MAG: hypothetical protein JNJ83_24235 [Verrucomicrobiaceae bacterium]|nr:hypothetical protein [Verrucomicrobiaceae bacterium]
MSKSAHSASAAQGPAAVQETSPIEQFLDKNFRKIGFAVLGIVALVVIAGIIRHRAHEADRAAAIAVSQAKTAADCDLVIAAHPGTTAAGNALLKKAKIVWAEGKKDSSIALLREFVGNYNSHPLRLQTLISLGTALEGTGQAAEARKVYAEIVEKHINDPLAGLAKLREADILWSQGKEDEAKKIYEMHAQTFPASPFFEDNANRLGWMKAALPTKEVDPPKPPPAAIAAPDAKGTPPKTPGATVTPTGSVMTNPAFSIPPPKPAANQPQPVTPPPANAPKPAPAPPAAATKPAPPPTSPATATPPAAPASKPATPTAPATTPAPSAPKPQ